MELTIGEFSIEMLDSIKNTSNKIHFDLTHVEDLDNIFQGTSTQFNHKITSMELRHIKENWEDFKDNVIFYFDVVTDNNIAKGIPIPGKDFIPF
ncbi:MAG: hypothetical protein F6K39_27900 [Okeania sp. SIO3B3]|nr:hypothetical protein [Okeania sp. SIO3B3]